MTKADLLKAIAGSTGIPMRDVAGVFKAFETIVLNTLNAGEKVAVPGIGILDVGHKAARMARNPKTGESAAVSARRVVKLRASTGLKSSIQ